MWSRAEGVPSHGTFGRLARARVARCVFPQVAKGLLRASGLAKEGVRGGLALMCGTNQIVGASMGMQGCSELMGEALDYAPSSRLPGSTLQCCRKHAIPDSG